MKLSRVKDKIDSKVEELARPHIFCGIVVTLIIVMGLLYRLGMVEFAFCGD